MSVTTLMTDGATNEVATIGMRAWLGLTPFWVASRRASSRRYKCRSPTAAVLSIETFRREMKGEGLSRVVSDMRRG